MLRYALIGCGMIAPSHIKAALNSELDIIAVCDLLQENRTRIIELLPEERRKRVKEYTDYNEMLNSLKPELVAIALGSGLKKKVSIDCMKAGANVIVEKPIALSLSDADEMIEASKEHDVKLVVNHQLRFGRTVRAVKSAVENGYFNKVFHGTVQIRRNRNQAYFEAAKWRGTWAQDGGTLMNQCIHYTDLLQWVIGSDVSEVFAYTDRLAHPYIEAEDMGLALVKFKNGAYGMIEGTINIYPKNLNDSLAIFGETGTVSLEGKTLEEVKAWDFKIGPEDIESAINCFHIEDLGEGHIPLYRNTIDVIQKGSIPLCSAEDGRKALELVLAIYKSQKSGAPVKLPLDDFSTMDMYGEF